MSGLVQNESGFVLKFITVSVLIKVQSNIIVFFCVLGGLSMETGVWAQSPQSSRPRSEPAKGKKFWTYPMTPKIVPTSPLKIDPAFAIPEPFEAYKFKTAEIDPKKSSGKIGVYDFDWRGRRRLMGNLSVGEVVALEAVRRFSNEHYYSFKFNDKTAWISGKNLAIESFTPPVN